MQKRKKKQIQTQNFETYMVEYDPMFEQREKIKSIRMICKCKAIRRTIGICK